MTKQLKNPGGLPYGFGSLHKRGLKWWAIYMDAEGVKVQVSTKTDDVIEARRFLVERALETARARVALLEELARAAPIRVTLKQGPVLEGPQLVAALKRLVEIGSEVEREERDRLQPPVDQKGAGHEKASAKGKGTGTARRDSRGGTGAGIGSRRTRSRAVPAKGRSTARKGGLRK